MGVSIATRGMICPASSGAGSPILSPVLTIPGLTRGADVDGVVSNFTSGSTNQIYIKPRGGNWGGTPAATADSNGDFTLEGLEPGFYYAYCLSSKSGVYAVSAPVFFKMVSADEDIDPVGIISGPLLILQDMLSQCETFQDWVGAVDAAEAKERIFIVAAEGKNFKDGDAGEDPRPYCVLGQGDGFMLESIAGGNEDQFEPGGDLVGIFEMTVIAERKDTFRDAEIEFTNTLGAILSELSEQSGGSEKISLHKIEKIAGPLRAEKTIAQSEGDFIQFIVRFRWGL